MQILSSLWHFTERSALPSGVFIRRIPGEGGYPCHPGFRLFPGGALIDQEKSAVHRPTKFYSIL